MIQPEVRFDNGHAWFLSTAIKNCSVVFWIISHLGIEEFQNSILSSQEKMAFLWPKKDKKEETKKREVKDARSLPPAGILVHA
jgi:hypothetical protein